MSVLQGGLHMCQTKTQVGTGLGFVSGCNSTEISQSSETNICHVHVCVYTHKKIAHKLILCGCCEWMITLRLCIEQPILLLL